MENKSKIKTNFKTFGQMAFERNNKNILKWLEIYGKKGQTYKFVVINKDGKTKIIKHTYL